MIHRFATIALCCFASFGLEAKIVETKHVEQILSFIDEETWLLVDLDNCMFQAAQALGHANWFYDELQHNLQQGMSREEAIAEAYPGWIKTQRVCKVKPLEESFVPLLHTLQSKKITIMGLTHRQPSVADSTRRQVNSLGFDFLTTAPFHETLVIPAKTPPLYTHGILFVGDYNKKIDIFESFLSIIKNSPKKVVFIDDKRKNVEELENLIQHDIEYIGIHYTAIEDSKPVYVREIADFQSKFLDQIMSNEAALLLMEKGLE
jgi:hypothetical protein